MVLLSVLVGEATDEGYHARDLDEGAAVETIRVVGGEKALPDDWCQFHVKYLTDIVWQALEFSVQETNLFPLSLGRVYQRFDAWQGFWQVILIMKVAMFVTTIRFRLVPRSSKRTSVPTLLWTHWYSGIWRP